MKIKRIGEIGLCMLAMLFSFTAFFPVYAITDSDQINGSQALEPNSVVVNTIEEFDSALSEDNGITHIYIGADITQPESYGGIAIHPSKESVVIDGLAPNATERSTFTLGEYENIHLLSENTKKIEVKNLYVNCYSVVPFIYVDESYTGVTTIFDNIKYLGNGMVNNVNGIVKVIDSNIRVGFFGVSSSNKVILEGDITIDGNSIGMFVPKGDSSSFTVAEGAKVNVKNDFGFFISAGYYPTVTFEANSSLNYVGTLGFQFDDQALESLTIKSGATVNVTQTSEDFDGGFFRIRSKLRLEEGSSLYMNQSYGDCAFEFTEAGASAVFDNPEHVELNVLPGAMFYYHATGTLEINTDTMNYWNSANDNDSIENMPTYLWNKETGETLNIEATFQEDTMQTFTSNFDLATDPTPTDLTSDTLNLSYCQKLVFGRFDLNVNKVTSRSTVITGTAEDNAPLNITYPTLSGDLTVNGSAVGSNFALAIDQRPVSDGEVTVLAHSNNLKRITKTTVTASDAVDAGEGALSFKYVPSPISFGEHQIPAEATLYERASTESMQVIIEDTRSEANSWSLYVSVQKPLTTTINGNEHTLTDALVYIKDSKETALTSDLFKVITHEESHEIEWEQNEGILLRANPWETYSGEYHATIGWSLHDTP